MGRNAESVFPRLSPGSWIRKARRNTGNALSRFLRAFRSQLPGDSVGASPHARLPPSSSSPQLILPPVPTAVIAGNMLLEISLVVLFLLPRRKRRRQHPRKYGKPVPRNPPYRIQV
ncbi:hypothetical protein C8F01DRAFT_1237050 [Mycena amicta]|nr:hypothetical protein C8F01DRAFT_1237050 [Mycena amicta]